MGSDSVTQWAFPMRKATQCLVPYSENKGYETFSVLAYCAVLRTATENETFFFYLFSVFSVIFLMNLVTTAEFLINTSNNKNCTFPVNILEK